MTASKQAGVDGEHVGEWVLIREGWKIVDRQFKAAGGHVLDFLAVHPVFLEHWLVEMKTWGDGPSGRDTVKKAIADAYDLRELGEPRPLLLLMSHRLDGLLGDMLSRARRAGAINEIRVISSTEHYGT